ncbi:alpha/beta fold hydrolase [Rhizobium sp. MC63]|uniref:Alpha/beta fold hydrolase n=1 Tax=Rhizobium mulingense TaxID=3031128 RepID=A0ACC6N2E6_9HYPH|nr:MULTISPECIES: alpha/beta fold hydrolase [unclassified Rhizobium]MDF0699439.1 alpha/beta fold hydrolase [Rhizobium sp. MC63]MEA3519756.1 alpha/beta fold hydrolase [Rhizobium sp. MJ31]
MNTNTHNADWKITPTQHVEAAGTRFAYRRLGPDVGVPIVLFNHWGANLDNFDPRIVEGLASVRPVYALDYRGVGNSGGTAPLSVAEMAADTIATIRVLGLKSADVIGFSLGGFVAQQILFDAPDVVRRAILAGTGPAGGTGIERVGRVSWPLKQAAFGRKSENADPQQFDLALEDLETAIAAIHAEDEADSPSGKPHPKPRAANRGALPAYLPRIEEIIEPESLICACGGGLHCIGEDASERLDVIPAQFRVIVTRRPKYACRACTDGVAQAPAPARLIQAGLPTEATIAHVLVSNTPIICPCIGRPRS